ncbi:MAG: hypothetical protein QXO12_02650 [Candidatus Pacearchaeota archaeon]
MKYFLFNLENLNLKNLPIEIKIGREKIFVDIVDEVVDFKIVRKFMIKDSNTVLYQKNFFNNEDNFLIKIPKSRKNKFELFYIGKKFVFEDRYYFYENRWRKERVFRIIK